MIQVSGSVMIKETDYKKFNTTDVTMLPIDVEFDQVSLLSCASRCSSSNKTCYSYIYNKTTRHCSLGFRLLPLTATDPPALGEVYSANKVCNTTKNTTVTWDGPDPTSSPEYTSIYHNQLRFYIVLETCGDLDSSDPRPIVTLKSGLQVMCDTVTDGGGWTIFQRRVSGTVDFYRNWTEYKNGFGDFTSGDLYLGNENIHLFTSQGSYELRIDLMSNGTSYFAKYSSFSISSEGDGYMLDISGFSGTVNDYLDQHNNRPFSTYDNGTDENCAVTCQGAWWYNNCCATNLNGQWTETSSSIYWGGLSIYLDHRSYTEMKFKHT
ncbi:fibrinogen-like protein A [Physella acuta]|uniref:fibrinogen-like protein A n=1 Tax=Physella acuta TaxID=109671 RepID=UPI0027DBE8D5|nr:fibrinogen-like protein A [Physella acuta]